jgi:hypothetical protein
LYMLALVALATYRLACNLYRLYMVCNSLQGVDGLAAWSTGGMHGILAHSLGNGQGIGYAIQAHTLCTELE